MKNLITCHSVKFEILFEKKQIPIFWLFDCLFWFSNFAI